MVISLIITFPTITIAYAFDRQIQTPLLRILFSRKFSCVPSQEIFFSPIEVSYFCVFFNIGTFCLKSYNRHYFMQSHMVAQGLTWQRERGERGRERKRVNECLQVSLNIHLWGWGQGGEMTQACMHI
jgi:hypothetical protein